MYRLNATGDIISTEIFNQPSINTNNMKGVRAGDMRTPPASGRAIAQSVSRWLPTAAARVQTRV
jgi:hypothetical protein